MDTRKIETGLARITLGILVIYVPAETWVSLPYGLLHPMYLVDVVAMLLLLFGSWFSLRSRPRSAAGPLAAAWAWTSANGWRATSWRWLEVREGGSLDLGAAELWATAGGTALSLICCVLALILACKPSTALAPGSE